MTLVKRLVATVGLVLALAGVATPALAEDDFPHDLYTPSTIGGIFKGLQTLHRAETASAEEALTIHNTTERFSFIGFVAAPLEPISDEERELLGHIHKEIAGSLGQAPFDMTTIRYKTVITDNRANVVLFVQEALVADLQEKIQSDPSSPIQCFSMLLASSCAKGEVSGVIMSLNAYKDL